MTHLRDAVLSEGGEGGAEPWCLYQVLSVLLGWVALLLPSLLFVPEVGRRQRTVSFTPWDWIFEKFTLYTDLRGFLSCTLETRRGTGWNGVILAFERKREGWKMLRVAECAFFLIGQGTWPFAVWGKLRKCSLYTDGYGGLCVGQR